MKGWWISNSIIWLVLIKKGWSQITPAFILNVKKMWSEGGFDAHKYILTTHKPDPRSKYMV